MLTVETIGRIPYLPGGLDDFVDCVVPELQRRAFDEIMATAVKRQHEPQRLIGELAVCPRETFRGGGHGLQAESHGVRRPSRDHLKILPGCFVVVGDTVEEARAKRAKLDSLVHYANAIGSLSIALGHDASKFDPDGPLPDIPESNASKSGRQRAIDLAKRENLTVRHDAIGIGVNFDRTSNRAGGYRVLVVVEAHQAGLRYRRLYRVEAIEPARIRN